MRRIAARIALCLILMASAASPGRASLWIGYVAESASKAVIMNLFGMNGLSWDMRFRPVHEVEALDLVRRDLVRARRIRDLPVLVVGPWYGERRNRVSLEAKCETAFGDAEAEVNREPLGECYRVELAGHHGIGDQIALLTVLPRLTAGVGGLEVRDLQSLRAAQSSAITAYRNLELHFDPIWSPDGNQLLYTQWRPGALRLQLLELGSGQVTALEPLEGYMVARPVWSADSRFAAYASLETVKVYDTRTRATWTFRPTDPSCHETLIGFEGSVLRFAFDTACWRDYEVHLYDAVRGEQQRLPEGAPVPGGPEQDLGRHVSLDPARSPNGRWIAVFTFVDGQRRIRVNPLR